jgi:hypothetical protein
VVYIKKLQARCGCFEKDIKGHPHPKYAVRDPKMQMLNLERAQNRHRLKWLMQEQERSKMTRIVSAPSLELEEQLSTFGHLPRRLGADGDFKENQGQVTRCRLLIWNILISY